MHAVYGLILENPLRGSGLNYSLPRAGGGPRRIRILRAPEEDLRPLIQAPILFQRRGRLLPRRSAIPNVNSKSKHVEPQMTSQSVIIRHEYLYRRTEYKLT